MLGLFGYSSHLCAKAERHATWTRELPSHEAHSPQKSRETRELGRDFGTTLLTRKSKNQAKRQRHARLGLASCQVAKANVAAETRDSPDLELRLGRDLLSRKDQFLAIPEAHAT
ncbi:hypothetical protein ACOSP7_018233 [Xanthoceras sorbifolium]